GVWRRARPAREGGRAVRLVGVWACRRGGCRGARTSRVARRAPAAAEPYPINRRRVTLPRYQNSSLQSCVFVLSVIACSSQVACYGAASVITTASVRVRGAPRPPSCFPRSRDCLDVL